MNDLIVRTYAAEFDAQPRKRIIEGRAVPYGVAELVADVGAEDRPYRERWMLGAFAQQAGQPASIGRVRFTYNHESGLRSWLGKTLDLTERADGMYGRWRVDETDDGDVALYKAADGQLGGLSIGARPMENVTGHDGTVDRVRAWLDHVSLVDQPAFTDARVLAVRAKIPPARRQSASERLEELQRKRPDLT